jgi:hypothetical protein
MDCKYLRDFWGGSRTLTVKLKDEEVSQLPETLQAELQKAEKSLKPEPLLRVMAMIVGSPVLEDVRQMSIDEDK